MSDSRPAGCWLVSHDSTGLVTSGPAALPWDPLQPPRPLVEGSVGGACEAVVRVEAAGLNYKDALACAGHEGVVRKFPLIPGIDAAGTLVYPGGGFQAGMPVVVTANQMGEGRHGGCATQLRIPFEAVVPRPAGLSAHDAMAMGTAGLTVLIACDRLDMLVSSRGQAGIGEVKNTEEDQWLVTGASGGVGMLAVATLAVAGRRVVACTRKPMAHDALKSLGASQVLSPAESIDSSTKPLVRARWAGVIDTVGGVLLADVLRAVRPGGAVAVIGMAGGTQLHTTVYPFILRGVTLAGIDTSTLPTPQERQDLWPRLAALWPRIRDVFPVTTIGLEQVGSWADAMRRGESIGRAVVVPQIARLPSCSNDER